MPQVIDASFAGARQKSDEWIMPRLDDRPSIPKNPQSVH